MRGIAFTFGVVGFLTFAAEAQELAPPQTEAITAFATVVAAAESCGFELSTPATAEMAEEGGITPELLYREPFAGLLLQEEERIQAGIGVDREEFCERAWARFGAEGTTASGVLQR